MEKNKMITARDVDFAKWYTDIVKNAHLATYSNVKGCVILEPNGYAIWENIQKVLDKKFKELGHVNVYMPLFIPESLLNKEKEHVEGFAPEVAWITKGGNNELEEKMCVRPTSETLFCDYYKDVVKSYKDLPKLYNQWCNVVRWEKETRPFLRTREFLWQEGHTLHETVEEAEHETYQMLEVYRDFYENYLAIPTIIGKKTEKEKFAGAEYTLTIEALMYNGVCLQGGTSHYFGQKFTKPFEIKYATKNNTLDYPYQTSWGVSTRMIGGIIMVHSDDNGLILPPRIAPKQIVIVPITDSMLVQKEVNDVYEKLCNDFRVFIDNSDKTPGYKYSEHEMNGIPLRIEIGPKDLENEQIVLARRDNGLKVTVSIKEDIKKIVSDLLEDIHNNMYEKAKKRNDEKTYICKTYDEVKTIIDAGPALIKAMWCGSEICELKMKELKGLKSRCIPFVPERISDTCVYCGKKAKHMVYWGNQY